MLSCGRWHFLGLYFWVRGSVGISEVPLCLMMQTSSFNKNSFKYWKLRSRGNFKKFYVASTRNNYTRPRNPIVCVKKITKLKKRPGPKKGL
jgi:hypothetical protein